jgi:dipeptidyl aminopeptidase/acylaminoacyl peptidase
LKLVPYALAALAGASFLFLLLILVKSYMGGRADYVRSPPADISRHPERTEIPRLREISFTAADGSRIAAWYAESANRAAVVLVHGTDSDRSAVLWETRVLAKAGFGALALDLPGQGASGGRTYWGVPDSQAISAAVSWLTARPEVDPLRIG